LGGYLLLLLAAAVGFVLGGPPENTIFWNGVFDVGHACLFGFVALTALRAVEGWLAPEPLSDRGSLAIFAVILIAAAVSELMQYFQPTRHPSVGDFLRDGAGSGAVFLIWKAGRTGVSRSLARFCRAGAAGLLVIVLIEFGLRVDIYVERDRSFPVLLRFNNARWERQLLRVHGGRLSPPEAGSGEDCARLVLNPGRVPALTFEEPYPDWTGWRSLTFSVMSRVESTFVLRVRVSDADYNGDDDDAFYKDFHITKGVQEIDIPIEMIRNGPARRTNDLRRIRNITMFVWRPTDTIDMCLSPFRLQ
jgi:hypothetical protein